MSAYPAQTRPPRAWPLRRSRARSSLPAHARFDEARRAWNLAIDQRPAAVVFPESAQDVAAAVVLADRARAAGRPAGDRPQRRSARLARRHDPAEDRAHARRRDRPRARIARVEAGALWLEVVEAAARHGLAALAGSSPDVGVVGYTLGGGISLLGRKHGLAANASARSSSSPPTAGCVRATATPSPTCSGRCAAAAAASAS